MSDGTLTKRAFLRQVLVGVSGAAGLPAVARAATGDAPASKEIVPPQTVNENHIVRMMRDARRSSGSSP